jgi:hypothetical protein
MKKYLLVVMLIGCLALLAGCITVVIPTEKPAPTQLLPNPLPPMCRRPPRWLQLPHPSPSRPALPQLLQ